MENHMNRKPRRIRGTPANRFINLVSLGTITVGTVIGILLCSWETARSMNQKVIDRFRFSEEHLKKKFELQLMLSRIQRDRALKGLDDD